MMTINRGLQEHTRLLEAIIKKNKESEPIDANVQVAIKELTQDPAFQKAIERRNEFYLPDSSLQYDITYTLKVTVF